DAPRGLVQTTGTAGGYDLPPSFPLAVNFWKGLSPPHRVRFDKERTLLTRRPARGRFPSSSRPMTQKGIFFYQ
ncbi:hypothetical protein, partial [Pyramidobacter piscolens]|uniref:hypothetical protein n=1 Tax=Pyramidobacter piscolens TaxID=638849 RepID=UPI00266BB55A